MLHTYITIIGTKGGSKKKKKKKEKQKTKHQIKQGMCYSVALPFTLKSILKATEEL
jgi:hypothetical protein